MKKYILSLLIILFACNVGYSQELDYVVRIKLKPQRDLSYLATKDAKMISLASKHGVTLTQTWPVPEAPRELLLDYDLRIKGSTDKESKDRFIKDFLATGKFEDEVFEYGISHAANCTNPVSVNDPDFKNSNGWALKMIQAPCAWDITTGNQDVLIGIADTDFRTTHEDLQNKFKRVSGATSAGHHHGTMVASVAAAATNNEKGIAGMGYNSRIVARRFVHTINPLGGPSANDADIRNAILNLFQQGVPIINVSWTETGLTRQQAEEITQAGTTLVLAGGNNATVQCHSAIATVPGVIVVSSVDSSNRHGPTGYARNQWIDICAPGIDIRVAGGNSNTHYDTGGGTSLSAPFVSGTIALMLSVNPNLTPAEIEQILKLTADPIDDESSYSGLLGAGRLNAYRAVSFTPKITGPKAVCTLSGYSRSFSVTNAPSGFTWGKSSNLTFGSSSGNSILVGATGGTTGWISINWNGVELIRHHVRVSNGVPVFLDIDGPEEVTPGSLSYHYESNFSNTPTEYEWEVYGAPSSWYVISTNGGSTTDVCFIGNATYYVYVTGYNGCGSDGGYMFVDAYSYNDASYAYYPNPTSDILTVKIDQKNIDKAIFLQKNAAQRSSSDPTFDIRLYDGFGVLHRHITTNKAGNVQLDVFGLPDGIYYLHIHDGVSKEPEKKQIVVKHN